MSYKSLRWATTGGKPSSAHGYFDRVQLWLKRPATRSQLADLDACCGHLYAENRSARFNSQYRQRVDMKQPNRNALSWVAAHDDALITIVEIALDLAFDSPADRDDTQDWLRRHLIRRWHGKQQEVFCVEETRYDASRAAPNQIVFYREEHSRITGELNCLHIEWRANRARAVRSAGIITPQDLLVFPFREFWSHRLLLVDLDEEGLGRYLRNTSNRTRSRKSPTVSYGYGEINLDRRLGHSISANRSIQEVVDQYRGINRCFQVLSNQDLLPQEEEIENLGEKPNLALLTSGLGSYGAFGRVVT